MDKLKEKIVKANDNPLVIFSCNAITIISFPFLFLSDNIYLKFAILFAVFVVLMFWIGRVTRISRKKEEWKEEQKELNEKIYGAIENLSFNYCQCLDAFKFQTAIPHDVVNNYCKNICDSVEDVVSFALSSKVCVCIKLFEETSQMNDDIDNWKIYTMGRSKSTPRKRRTKDKKAVLLCRNSDFEEIVLGNCEYFIVPDIPDLIERWKKDNKEYKNSSQDYEKHYRSTIVFPIAAEYDKVDESIKQHQCITATGNAYHILGFLCVDSKESFLTENADAFNRIADTVESIAQILYPLFEYYIVHQKIPMLNKVS